MVVRHSESAGSDAGPAVESDSPQEIDARCAQCVQRAFGILAMGEDAPTGALTNAMNTIQSAEETWTYTARTRATIYRCKASECSHAILTFTMFGTPTIPEARDLHLEPLPGTCDCVLPPDLPERPPGP